MFKRTKLFIVYVFTMFIAYLFVSAIFSLITGHGYREVLCSQYQAAFMFGLYWWIPIIPLYDIYRESERRKINRIKSANKEQCEYKILQPLDPKTFNKI